VELFGVIIVMVAMAFVAGVLTAAKLFLIIAIKIIRKWQKRVNNT
jgi:hypothetical protein